LEKIYRYYQFQKNRQRYNVTRKNMQNLVSALTNLNFQYIFIDCPAGIDVGLLMLFHQLKH
jgi:septum formation inhibitor-activating ATPase MinD